MYLRESAGASSYITIPAGASLSLDCHVKNMEPFALRAASGNPIAEILVTMD